MKDYPSLSSSTRVVGVKAIYNSRKFIDFYIVHPKQGKKYVFTRRYTQYVYDLTKGGILVKNLLRTRSSDDMIMALIKQLSYVMPCIMTESKRLAA